MEKKFIKNVNSAEEVKEKYFKLYKKYLKDFDTLKKISDEFDELMKDLKNIHPNTITNEIYQYDYKDNLEDFKNIMHKYVGVYGVDVEVKGCFVFISGKSTVEIKEELKRDGFRWQNEKQRWYFSSRPHRGRAFYQVQEAKLATA